MKPNGVIRLKKMTKIARVPTLSDFYTTYEYDYIDIGLQTVNVKDIVGMTNGRNDEYNSDFSPINESDSRWIYQYELVSNGGSVEPIPLIKTPDGEYFGSGDGSHRISVLKVLNINNVDAHVKVMVPMEDGIEDKWIEHASEKINLLEDLSKEYESMLREFANVQDNGTRQECNEYLKEMQLLSDKIGELDKQLIEEEKEFKINFLNL